MKFGAPSLSGLLWIFVILIFFYAWAVKKRRQLLEIFSEKSFLSVLIPSIDDGKRRLKNILTLVGIFLIIIALMRPQWGFTWQEVKRRGLEPSRLATQMSPA